MRVSGLRKVPGRCMLGKNYACISIFGYQDLSVSFPHHISEVPSLDTEGSHILPGEPVEPSAQHTLAHKDWPSLLTFSAARSARG